MSEREMAETMALRALAWLAEDGDRLAAFLAATGASHDDILRLAADPGFLAAVFDHLLSANSLVTGFCDAEGLAYDRPMRARAALPGGADPHWT